jgi:adenosine deaminase CECR1
MGSDPILASTDSLTILFSNSVSHEFYQIMVGAPSMSLYGWHQLTEWSITHSCLSTEQQIEAHQILKNEWKDFCHWVVDTYGAHADTLDIPA